MRRIGNIIVDKISLLTTEHQPAVEKAGLGFSILKFFTPKKINKSHCETLDRSIDIFLKKKDFAIKLDDSIEKFEKLFKKNEEQK